MLVDSHCHLDFPELNQDLESVLARAGRAGVGAMLTIGTTMEGFAKVRGLAEAHANVFCSVGIHPHEAANEPGVTTAHLVKLVDHPKVVGIGETGLDYFYEHSPREVQQRLFREHIAAARETGLPLIVHTRNADQDTATILTEEMKKGPFRGLIHCFSSAQELADIALELGLYISISGIVTFNKAEGLREVARNLPLDRLLVETDAPYLAPVPKRGRPNEPAFVAHTAACVAEARNMALEELAAATTDNFFRLFEKADRAALGDDGAP